MNNGEKQLNSCMQILEYAPGGTLYDVFRKDPKLCSEHEARHYAKQIVGALAYCHSIGVVSDSRCSNISAN